jgi:hypothetical protein
MVIEKDPEWCDTDGSGLGPMIFWYCEKVLEARKA